MEAFIMFILNLYVESTLAAVGIKLAKEYFANKRIEKNGYKITKGDREVQEVVYDILKEYTYCLVPIRNIKKSWKLIWGSNKKYANQKLAKLQEQGRIEKLEEIEAEPVVEEKTKKPETKPEKTTPKKNKELVVDEYVDEINNSTNIEFISSVKTTYRQKSLELRERHAKLKSMVATSTNDEFKKKCRKEMSSIARRVNAYDKIFVAARDRLYELKQKNQSAQRRK